MGLKARYSRNQLRDYSAIFSRSSALEWLNGNFDLIDFKIARYDSDWLDRKSKTYSDYLKYTYKVLEKHYKNEYILKNTFLNKWLIKELGEANSQVFNEFRVGKAVADLVMFNGKSKVFEIKTELDSDKRLYDQLKYYKKVFNEVYLIVPFSKVKIYQRHDKKVGIITFDENAINSFQLFRKPDTIENVDYETIVDIFHTPEYKKVVEQHFGKLPEMTSFNQYEICKDLISKIPPSQLSQYFIDQMKKRDSSCSLSAKNHKELNQLTLALRLSEQKRKEMINCLKQPLKS